MPRTVEEIVAEIRGFEPVDESWTALDDLVGELFRAGPDSRGIDATLSIFERYPTEDGCGVFWTILHGLESLPNHESSLIESVRRAPGEFSLRMVARLINAGETEAGGAALSPLVCEVAGRPDVPPEIREQARKILARG